MEAFVFSMTRCPTNPDEKYMMADDAWRVAIEAQDHQWALAVAPVGAPSVCQLPGGPSLKIDLQTREAVGIYSLFCTSIGLLIMPNCKNIHSEN
jgi:hypothetical protein